MYRFRIESLQWLVGLFCGLLGTVMLVSPHQFKIFLYIIPSNALYPLGLSLLLVSIGMLGVNVLEVKRRFVVGVHLLCGLLILGLGTAMISNEGWLSGINLFLLGLGTAIAPLLEENDPAAEAKAGDLLALIIGVGAALVGLALLNLVDQDSYGYDLHRLVRLFFGYGFAACGVLLIHLETTLEARTDPLAGTLLRWIYYVSGFMFLTFLFAATQPERFWFSVAYYGWFGVGLFLMPRLFAPGMQYNPRSLNSRMALAFGLAASLPLICTVALVNWLNETGNRLLAATSRNTESDLALGTLLIFLVITVYAGIRLAAWLSSPLGRLAAAAQALAENDRSAPLPVSAVVEIRHLSDSFDLMRSRLAERTAERERAHRQLEEHQAQLEQRVIERTAELEQARQHLEAVLNALPVGVFISDAQGGLIRKNTVVDKVWGGDTPQFQSIEDYAAYPGWWADSGKIVEPEEWGLARAVTRGETSFSEVIDIQKFNGEKGTIINSAAPILDKEGRIQGAVVVVEDITAIKETELALRKSEALSCARADELAALMDAVPAAVWIAQDPQCQQITGNQAAYRLHNLPPGANPTVAPCSGKPQMNIRNNLNGEELTVEKMPMQVAASQGIEQKDLEVDLVFEDGEVRHLYGNVSPLLDEQGKPRGAVGAFLDISDLVKTEKALRESEARFRGLVKSINDLVVTIDPQLRFTGIYGLSVERFGLSVEDILGKRVDEVMKMNSELHENAVIQALSGMNNVLYEWIDNTLMGLTHFQVSLSPLRDDKGQVTGVVGVIHDITALKRAEENLGKLAGRLQSSNQELEQFAFIASHDLQEPLRKIQAFGQRLQQRMQDRMDAEELNYLARMVSAAERMQKMIEDLLTFSRVTTQGKPFTTVDLNQVVQEVLGDLEVQIERTGGMVNVSELPRLEADPLQMQQLFQNLIGNSLKYHQSGIAPEISLSAGPAVPESNALDVVRIEIVDNGIGFDEKYLERIFQPFERLHGRGEYEGTGMGLAICRKIVERHHGSISARSQPGAGTTFIVDLPLRQQPGWENHPA